MTEGMDILEDRHDFDPYEVDEMDVSDLRRVYRRLSRDLRQRSVGTDHYHWMCEIEEELRRRDVDPDQIAQNVEDNLDAE